jgi:hypothetical protein
MVAYFPEVLSCSPLLILNILGHFRRLTLGKRGVCPARSRVQVVLVLNGT